MLQEQFSNRDSRAQARSYRMNRTLQEQFSNRDSRAQARSYRTNRTL